MSNEKKSYGPDTNLHRQTENQTDGEPDGQTDRRTDRVISIYPLNFVHGGYNFKTAAVVQSVRAFVSHAEGWVFESQARQT